MKRTLPGNLLVWAGLIILGMILGAVLPGQFRTPPPSEAVVQAGVVPPANVLDLNRAFSQAAASVKPAVVNINTRGVIPGRRFRDPFEDFFRGRPPQEFSSLGSGAIIRPDGYIVTNNHVVRGPEGSIPEISVTLADGRKFQAKVVGTDPTSDIACLKIDADRLPFLGWGDSEKLQVGEWVIAVGSPLGFDQTVTAGIVSAKGRKGLGITPFEDFIQTDAAINRGNSGGPLVSIDGRIVGINTIIISNSGGFEGIGFAVPSAVSKQVTETLISGGRILRGWLGVGVEPVRLRESNSGTVQRGLMVTLVTPRGPAAGAGIQARDVILAIDDKPVTDGGQFRSVVASAKIGTPLKLRVWREGKTLDVLVKTEGAPVDAQGRPAPGV